MVFLILVFLILVAPQFALAAIAAAGASFTAMIGAAILGAIDANVLGRLVADATEKCGDFAHNF